MIKRIMFVLVINFSMIAYLLYKTQTVITKTEFCVAAILTFIIVIVTSKIGADICGGKL